MRITGVILAAGMSSRMGRNKLLLTYRGRTVIEEVLCQLGKARVDEIIVVTGYESSQIEKQISGHLGERITVTHNSKYRLGRAESIKSAIRQIGGQTDAALFMAADKPGVSSELINRAIEEFETATPAVLYVMTPSGRGHPIIFSRELFSELLSLSGDCIGNALVEKHKNRAVALMDDIAQIDINTVEDYRRLIKENVE